MSTRQDHPAMEVFSDKGATISNSPFVEAYIQYGGAPGTDNRWNGPQSVILHVVARQLGSVRMDLTPPLWENNLASGATRTLASAPKMETKSLTLEQARSRLGDLARDLGQVQETTYRGCLYPVNIWIVQQDGAIFERKTCRGTYMSRVVSQAFDFFTSNRMFSKAGS